MQLSLTKGGCTSVPVGAGKAKPVFGRGREIIKNNGRLALLTWRKNLYRAPGTFFRRIVRIGICREVEMYPGG